MSGLDQTRSQPERERLWDLPLRLFHWTLVGCVGVGWYLGYYRSFSTVGWHFWLGYAVCGLLMFRIVWGLVGPGPARFSSLIWSPRSVVRYGATLASRTPSYFRGHSPVGSCSVIAMLTSLIVQVITGLCAEDDALFASGPLSEYLSSSTIITMTSFHYVNSRILLGLIVLHVSAIAWYMIWKRENLLTAMITGRKFVLRKNDTD